MKFASDIHGCFSEQFSEIFFVRISVKNSSGFVFAQSKDDLNSSKLVGLSPGVYVL